MRRTRLVLALASLFVSGWLIPPALAQDTRTARGTVTALAGDTVTVKTSEGEMKFTVDAKTVLTASGAGTASRQAEAAGKPGLNLAAFVKSGDNVEVNYQESGGTMRATSIRPIRSLGSTAERGETATGTVKAISSSTLTVTGSISGGGSFEQSFTIDGNTKVIAEGAGTASAKKEGKVTLTDFVGTGDQVTVTYRPAGGTLHADEVRVNRRKK